MVRGRVINNRRNNMKKVLVIPIVTVTLIATVAILSATSMGEENHNSTIPYNATLENNTISNSTTSNASNVKITVKSRFMGIEKNWNTEKVRMNITINRLGRLIYIENYYSQGIEGPKFYSTDRYYDNNLTSGNLTFNISRPRSKKTYFFIQSVVFLDNKVIFEQWLNLSNRTKLGSANANIRSPVKTTKNSTISETSRGVTPKPELPRSKAGTLSGTDYTNTTSKTDDINKANKESDIDISKNRINITEKEMTKKSPGFGILTAITVIPIIHLFRKKKNK